MVDSVQRTSSLPLPAFQTEKSVHDPLPQSAPAELKRVDETIKQATTETQQDGFEDYLNETSITTLERNQSNRKFDPVDEINAGSVYSQPGGKSPI